MKVPVEISPALFERRGLHLILSNARTRMSDAMLQIAECQ